MGSMPGMTALVEVAATHRTPKCSSLAAARAVADQAIAQHYLYAK
jgi:hypothetical protein